MLRIASNNPLPQLRPNRRGFIDDVRHGADRDTGPLRDLPHCYGAVMAWRAEQGSGAAVAAPLQELQLHHITARLDYAAEADSSRAVHAGGHQQQLAVLVQLVSLREIPDRSLRLVVTATAENAAARVLVNEILPSIARHFQPCPSRRRDWLPSDVRRPHPDLAWCAIYLALALRCRPIGYPKDRGGRPCLGPHTATPTHGADAFRPNSRRLARLPGKPRSPACSPNPFG